MSKEQLEYCSCEGVNGIYVKTNNMGYWDVCDKCDKPIEDSFYYHDSPTYEDL